MRVRVVTLLIASLGLLAGGAIISAGPALADTSCTGVLTGKIVGNVVVPTNAHCDIRGATITGDVTMQPGSDTELMIRSGSIAGDLIGLNPTHGFQTGPSQLCMGVTNCADGFGTATAGTTTVKGSITLDGFSYDEFICGANVSGALTITRSASFWVGDPTGDEDSYVCPGNTIQRGLTASNNGATFANPTIEENRIGGSVTVTNNEGGTHGNRLVIDGNNIANSLSCSGNFPAPDDLDGTTPDPNAARGSKSGQCAGL